MQWALVQNSALRPHTPFFLFGSARRSSPDRWAGESSPRNATSMHALPPLQQECCRRLIAALPKPALYVSLNVSSSLSPCGRFLPPPHPPHRSAPCISLSLRQSFAASPSPPLLPLFHRAAAFFFAAAFPQPAFAAFLALPAFRGVGPPLFRSSSVSYPRPPSLPPPPQLARSLATRLPHPCPHLSYPSALSFVPLVSQAFRFPIPPFFRAFHRHSFLFRFAFVRFQLSLSLLGEMPALFPSSPCSSSLSSRPLYAFATTADRSFVAYVTFYVPSACSFRRFRLRFSHLSSMHHLNSVFRRPTPARRCHSRSSRPLAASSHSPDVFLRSSLFQFALQVFFVLPGARPSRPSRGPPFVPPFVPSAPSPDRRRALFFLPFRAPSPPRPRSLSSFRPPIAARRRGTSRNPVCRGHTPGLETTRRHLETPRGERRGKRKRATEKQRPERLSSSFGGIRATVLVSSRRRALGRPQSTRNSTGRPSARHRSTSPSARLRSPSTPTTTPCCGGIGART